MTTAKLKFLGLGSMVDVNDMDALKDTKHVVIARAVGKDSKGATILRYMVAPHPFGDVPKQKDNILIVAESHITKVHVRGYVDEKDDQLLEEFLEGMNQTISKTNTSADKVSAPAISVEEEASKKEALLAQEQAKKEEMKRLELEKEQLRRDPFYKFRKKVEE